MGLWGLTPPADGAAGGVNHPREDFPGVGGFINETPPVKCVLWGVTGVEWGLAPPADGTAGGTNHPCEVCFGVGGFSSETPPFRCMS